ncbi:hypothetical protein O6H91_11G050800 [Diphasiastrum complanatum]|uniref:Uncharacterized protein n=1 Tax=Diphasiastrum complanatum TaxID=34168 RepID=A0ACC2C953_DIPCM|nr:hypothetical protein O6H91_11G050800 [Diphasiastrum complanatum]
MSTSAIQSPNVKRELDDEYLQNQAKEWLEAVVGARFEDQGLADALADGDILYHVSKLLKELLQESGEETAFPKLLSWETDFEGKKIGKYLPYSNVDSFLKICKRLRLPDIDLFTPPDVVEKKDIRRVCLCIRALSKKARANQMRIPDFDNVAVTWEIIQHDKVNGIDHMELAGNKSSIINSPSTSWNKSREAFQRESGCIASREATTSSTSLDARSTLPPVMGRDMLIVKPDKDNLIMQFPHQEGNRQLSNKQATNAQVRIVVEELVQNYDDQRYSSADL